VTRGRLPQRAGLPGLNGGGAAAAVPPAVLELCGVSDICSSNICVNYYIFCFEKTTAMSV